MDKTHSHEEITNAALSPSIVEHFSIEGLFGYRTISLNSKYAATVLIAKNGSGKTTLLGALDAFLRGQFTRLANLDFRIISCKLKGIPGMMQVSKQDVDQFMEICREVDFVARAKTWEVEPTALFELLLGDLESTSRRDLYDNPIFYSIYTKNRYEFDGTLEQCKRLAQKIKGRIQPIDSVRSRIKEALSDFEIVYLPTYRRIELSIPEQESHRGQKRRTIMARLGVSTRGLHAGDINFGLSDISDRLSELYRDIQFQSNRGYGKVSANIVNDLLTGAFEQSNPGLEMRPTKEALQIFFSRVKDAEMEYRYAPYSDVQIPDIEKIYSDDVPADSRKFLNYFLGQLNSVIQKTQDIESTVEQFIGNCNRYLSGDDESTKLYGDIQASTNDDKRLTFNKQNLLVTVTSQRTGKEIPLDSLSSGEKQMISLFAQLYLYPKKKLVLIDEPELSLSLDWQRKILPDILSAVTCEQVIAITHSPFIFDNALEPFASSLQLSYAPPPNGQVFPDNDIENDIDPRREGKDV